MSSKNRGGKRHHDDLYRTPAWVTRAILQRLPRPKPGAVVLDPACGDGAILDVVNEVWPDVVCAGFEIDSERASKAIVASLHRQAFVSSKKRAPFWRNHVADVHFLSQRPSFTGGATDSCDYAWFVFGAGTERRW